MSTKMELDEGEFVFRSRGLGLSWLPCFICGHKPQEVVQADMASFVDSGLVVVMPRGISGHSIESTPLVTHPVTDLLWRERFLATLDYREYEPGWVQVKLGACGEHELNLELLSCVTTMAGGKLTVQMLQHCLPKRRLP